MRIRVKSHDNYIRVAALPDEDQALLKKHGLTFRFVSYDGNAKISRVVEELKHGKVPLSFRNINDELRKQNEPEFRYLEKLNPHDLWIELNRTQSNVNKEKEQSTKYLLGLSRLSYHHVANKGQGIFMYRVEPSDTKIIFFYYGLPNLINDIKEKLNERKRTTSSNTNK